jgi:hypothetical protein
MTGHSPITAPPSPALDIVKLDDLIQASKRPYPWALAFARLGAAFSVQVRLVTNVVWRSGVLAPRVDAQKGVRIG